MQAAQHILESVFGFPGFRPGQEEIVRAVMAGEDVLAVMPTGGGKSLCYQLPALAREGLTVVVSPLIALMRDQVAQLRANGVEAGSLNSAIGEDERRRVTESVREGRMRLLYASPERLAHEPTLEWLSRSHVNLLAIDEAHCVSQWGHDFRPEYAALGQARTRMGGVQTIALTATADTATRADILARLFRAEPKIFVHGFDRPNLRLGFAPKDRAPRQIATFLSRHRTESGIVYCATRKDTDRLAQSLAKEGYRTLAYHGGMAAPERDRNQDVFLQEDGIVMVATLAFGMGIDKPDVRFVAHAALPKSIEAYYQEIGRAGRDGAPADTLTLYGFDDIKLRRMQIEESEAPLDQKRVEHQRLDALIALCEAPRCRRQTLLAYFNETSKPCGNCDLCEGGARTFDGTIDAQKILSAIARTGERFGAEHILHILMGEDTDSIRRHNHHSLKTFGVGKDRSKNDWRSLLRQIYASGLITLDLGHYGTWRITDAGWDVLQGKATVPLRADTLEQKPIARQSRQTAQPSIGCADEVLLTALKELRLRLAKHENVPAYVIFPDRTLIEMASLKPKTSFDLRHINGVGQAKLERYGDDFLTVIAAYL